jgi:hypothetical protein
MATQPPQRLWHDAVFDRDDWRCAAKKHDPRCSGQAETAHHIVFRRFLVDEAMWLLANGIALSTYCHLLAHATHNQNIDEQRLIDAVDAVNAATAKAHPTKIKGLLRPPFTRKGYA